MSKKTLFKRNQKEIPGPLNIPEPPQQPQQPQQNDKVYHIPFTIPEIDRLMTDLIDLNIPIQTFIILDSKFNAVKRNTIGAEARTFQSKMNAMEGGELIPDWEEGVYYRDGDTYVKRDPFGVFKIIKGQEIEITTNEGSDQSLSNGPGETNPGD